MPLHISAIHISAIRILFLTFIFKLRPAFMCRNLQPVIKVCLTAIIHAMKSYIGLDYVLSFQVIDSSPDETERENADRVHWPDLAKRQDVGYRVRAENKTS